MRARGLSWTWLVLCLAWVSAIPILRAQTAASVPSAEHKKLEVFAGIWTFEGESRAVPALGMTDAGRVTYRHVNEMANGGFFLETRRTGSGPRGAVTELFVYSYNTTTRTYRQDAYDSRGRVRTFTGTVDGLIWSFRGTNTNPDGSVTQERYTLTYDAGLLSARVRSEHSKDGVTWYERLTGVYTKVPGGPAGAPVDQARARAQAAAAKVYDTSVLHRIDVVIADEDAMKMLRRTDERVLCTFTFDGQILSRVGVRQSGGIYHSYVPLAGKPSLSVKFDEFVKGQTLFGVEKLVLKNELQDLSLINEHITYEVFRRAGLAAPLTAHARVTINGVDSGIYLMREPIDTQFLVRNFGQGSGAGNLYEIENMREFAFDPAAPALDDELKDRRSRADLQRLASTLQSSTPETFVANVSPLVDLDRFITFMAAEAATLHWDGFAFHNNNSYLFARPTDGRFVLIPWGADQTLGTSGRWRSMQPSSFLAQKVLSVPALAQQYRDEVDRMGRRPVWDQPALLDRVAEVARIFGTAESSGRTASDIGRFLAYRSTVEAYIRSGQ
jgi:spore coat protein H